MNYESKEIGVVLRETSECEEYCLHMHDAFLNFFTT